MLAPMTPFAQESSQPLLTVKEIMDGIITPTTNTIWGAYQLQSETEWLEVQNAALAVIGAGNLLALGGAAVGDADAGPADAVAANTMAGEAAFQALPVVIADGGLQSIPELLA